MLPRGEILARRADHAPWADEDDVEQDLLPTRALCVVFADGFLREHLAFRGGAAPHKLHLPHAARPWRCRRRTAAPCTHRQPRDAVRRPVTRACHAGQ